jgi:hypothetical protein
MMVNDRACGHRGNPKLIFGKLFIGETPHPLLPRLGGSHYWVASVPKVLGCMAVGRVVAAVGAPTLLAGAQVEPLAASFDTFFTYVRVAHLDFFQGF